MNIQIDTDKKTIMFVDEEPIDKFCREITLLLGDEMKDWRIVPLGIILNPEEPYEEVYD